MPRRPVPSTPPSSDFPPTVQSLAGPDADAEADSPLFRPEVMAGRRPRLAGEVLLGARPLWGGGVLVAALLAGALVLLVLLGSYTRRATVGGQLVPVQGVMRIVAPQGATVIEQRVQEGQRVRRGEVLYVLGTDRPASDDMVTLAGYQARIRDSIAQRRELLDAERRRTVESLDADIAALQRRLTVMVAERAQIAQQQDEQRRRIALSDESRQRQRLLFDQGLVTREAWQERERDLSDQRQRLQSLVRDTLTLSREQAQVEQQLEQARATRQTREQAIERELAQLDEQLADAEARRRIVIIAPQDGRATLLQGAPGTTVDAVRPLLVLLPDDTTLQAVLYAPSRTVGFVRPGTEVWLRHEAFPYQKFGHQRGEVVAVSTYPAGVDDQLGLSSFAPEPGAEPLYAITVRLDAQVFPPAATAPLRPGLRVQADLRMERRRLWEWMLEPLLTAGKAVQA
jgi:membrane fusion protein